MRLLVNGRPIQLEMGPRVTLQDALEKLGVRTEFIAVAVNFDCIARAEYSVKEIFENDEIEILSPHQGG